MKIIIPALIFTLITYHLLKPYRTHAAEVRADDARRRRQEREADTEACEEACADVVLLLALEELRREEAAEIIRKEDELIARFNQLLQGVEIKELA